MRCPRSASLVGLSAPAQIRPRAYARARPRTAHAPCQPGLRWGARGVSPRLTKKAPSFAPDEPVGTAKCHFFFQKSKSEMVRFLIRPTVALAMVVLASSQAQHEIAPGVVMPTVNLGGVTSKPSNYSAFLAMGGVGLDTALTYGEAVQTSVGDAIKKSGLPRSKIFVTT